MSRVIELLRIDNDSMVYTEFFKEKEWKVIINSFFIEGGLEIPNTVDIHKTLNDLNDSDFSILFEELGYNVVGINEYDPGRHIACSYPLTNKKGEIKA